MIVCMMVLFFILSLQSCMQAIGSGRENNCSSMQHEHVVGILIRRLMCCKSAPSQLTLSQQLLEPGCDRFMNQRKAPATKSVSSFLAGCCNPRRLSNQ